MPRKRDTENVLDIITELGNRILSLLAALLAAFLMLYSGYVLYDTFYTQNQAFSSTWDLLQYKPVIIEDGAVPLAGLRPAGKHQNQARFRGRQAKNPLLR